ncbi:response regulator transcription factor [Litoreibacter roseus]|uniref:HTH luxR-type domain-containing protein n=1 Tax=Litoreibacter roseus TaxID=2601869 RepID=A0A6N6JDX8_9RHOB|nr:helix-turn-helix transcriptional regulator [Litoreibacter roseus]GFE64177.1 hypothetical protein KIN_12510 [Litoreibacter roseus]
MGTVVALKNHLYEEQGTTLRQKLSRRETEVLLWIARGKSNQDISTILSISPHTVDTFCRRLMQKFDATSRTTAAVRAAQWGLLPAV